jgi:hypothetical protein
MWRSPGPVDADAVRSIAGSTPVVDRRIRVRHSESVDGDVLERRGQQPLNVAQQPRVSCRHE